MEVAFYFSIFFPLSTCGIERMALKMFYCFGWKPNLLIFLGTNFKIFFKLSKNPSNLCSRTGVCIHSGFSVWLFCLLVLVSGYFLSVNTCSDNMHCPEFAFNSHPYFSSQRNPVTILSEQGVTLFLFNFCLTSSLWYFFLAFSDKT